MKTVFNELISGIDVIYGMSLWPAGIFVVFYRYE